jgi:hypothetical protein
MERYADILRGHPTEMEAIRERQPPGSAFNFVDSSVKRRQFQNDVRPICAPSKTLATSPHAVVGTIPPA